MNSTVSNMRAWEQALQQKPIFSTHEHHREREFQQQLNLDKIFENSYVGWITKLNGSTDLARDHWIDQVRFNTYYVWLARAICRIYGCEEINSGNWELVSKQISEAHRDADHHIHLLKTKAKYIGFLEDCYWNSGSDVGYPEFITPVYRLDMWMQGFHPDSFPQVLINPHTVFGEIKSFDRYLEILEHEIRSRRPQIAALKCASAYQRTIAFEPVTYEQAADVFMKNPTSLTEQQRNIFGDYIMQFALRLAKELDLPVQIHTGLALLSGSNPLLLEGLIARHPDNRFVLFHGGFPWIYETAGLLHNYSNVLIDINWLPLISTSAAAQALHVYIDVLQDSGNIAWGGDTWTSEEACGASMAFRNLLARVLTEKIERDGWRTTDAERFADKIMFENALNIYKGKYFMK